MNEAARLVTGCLKPSPTNKVHYLAGIPPPPSPKLRRESAAQKEWVKATTSTKHPLFDHQPPRSRLKSRNSFLRTFSPPNNQPPSTALERWQMSGVLPSNWPRPQDSLPPGQEHGWPIWRSLNRLRTGVGRSNNNLRKWEFPTESTLGERGVEPTTPHLLQYTLYPSKCIEEDLMLARQNAVDVAQYWAKHI